MPPRRSSASTKASDEEELQFFEGEAGAVVRTPGKKTRITIRIDDDVLEWFRKQAHEAGGGSYQAMMNAALRAHVEGAEEPLEDTLRRVLREVLPGSGGRTRKATKKTQKKASAS